MKGYQSDIKRKTILFLGFIILILLALNIFPSLFGNDSIYAIPESYQYEVRIPAKGILVRDEKLYFSNAEGDLFKVAKEGERVRVGQKVADILLLEDTTDLKEELSQIENIMEFYDDLNRNSMDESTLNSTGIDLLVSKLLQQLENGDYLGINDIKESIEMYNDAINSFSGSADGLDITNEDLNARRDYLISRIAQYNKSIFSVDSGIVSYEIDGWEDELTFDKLNDLDADIFNHIESEGKDGNEAVFKIIDDYQWYLLIVAQDENRLNLKVGDILDVAISSLDNKMIVEARMPIFEIVEDDSGNVIMLRGTDFLEKIFDRRLVNVEIVDLRKETLRIPIDAVVEVDGIKGVKVKEFYGVVSFRPVEIVGIDERYAYISKGDNNGYIDIGQESFRTISLFSEVIGKPDSVEVGDILN